MGDIGNNSQTASVILDIVGLIERKNFTPQKLVGEQQQRVAIARALIGNPKLILAVNQLETWTVNQEPKSWSYYVILIGKKE